MIEYRLAGCLLTLTAAMYAQNVISARSGLIHYVEGKVALEGKFINPKPSEFPEVGPGKELRTTEGRAEVLLTPGVFLRVGENSGIRMISNQLENTRLEVLGGSVLVEAAEVEKGQAVTLQVGSTAIEFPKPGVYRVDTNPARLSVYDGAAVIVAGQQTMTVKEGRQTELSGVLLAEKFNRENTDAFYRWAARRASYISLANMAAAKRLSDSGTTWNHSMWYYNPYFGAFTYIPYRGRLGSYFGGTYYSPGAVVGVYQRREPVMAPHSMDSGFGAASAGRSAASSGGYVGYTPSAPAASAPSAPAAPAGGARSGGGEGSRGSASGR